MNIEFRPATPDDAEIAVPLIYRSGPPAFEFVFPEYRGKRAQDFLRYAFRRRGTEFSHTNHTVVVCDRRVVGVGASYTADTATAFLIGGARQTFAFYGPLGFPRVLRRGLQIESLFKLPEQTKDYLGHLGVLPELQGRGIGRQLVEYFLDQGRSRDQTHATLDVSVKNTRAQTLYERIGFETVELRVSRSPGVPDHNRMEIRL